MQGIIKDDRGAYVKSAIVRLLKISDTAGESEEEAVTYAETNEDGKFIIGDLEPGERYFIEIHVEVPEPEEKKVEPEAMNAEPEVKKDEPEAESEATIVNIFVNGLNNIGFDPKDKPYLRKINTW